jgi:hypothetical protein
MVLESEDFKNKASKALNFEGHYKELRDKKVRLYEELANNIGLKCGVDAILIPKGNPLLRLKPNVKLISDVNEINFDFNKINSVTAVNFTSRNKTERIKVDEVVISSGGIGSNKLLKQVIKDGKLDVGSDTVIGSGLIDHPMGFIGKIKIKKEFFQTVNSLVLTSEQDFFSRCAFIINDNEYTHAVYLRPSVTMTNSSKLNRFRSKLASAKGFELIKLIFDSKLYHPDILGEIYAHLFGKNLTKKVFSFLVVFEQKKSKTNFVDTAEDVDNIHWNIEERELTSYRKIQSYLADIFEPIADKMNFIEEDISELLWSAAHHSGTTEIAENRIGAVNKDLRINGVNNVFICDGSVVDSHSYVNTGLTIAQLGFRLSHHLKNRALVS